MKKLCMTISIVLAVLSGMAAQSLDYRQVVFGNNYENIIEINATTFFEQYPQVKNIEGYGSGQVLRPPWATPNGFTSNWIQDTHFESPNTEFTTSSELYFRVYEEKVGENIFYRLLCSRKKLVNSELLRWDTNYFDQELFYKLNETDLLHIGSYTYRARVDTQSAAYPNYQTVDIIQRNGRIIGILNASLRLCARTGLESPRSYWIENDAIYYVWKDITANQKTVTNGMKQVDYSNEKELSRIRIEASTPLVDSKRPFMYTIQNAFDGNPATSYVEDTEDDLMHIGINIYIIGKADKILVINGYAQNETIYKNNNRIKELSHKSISGLGTVTEYSNKKLILEDITLDKQIQDWWGSNYFTVTDIYKGSKYTDTCLSELDFYIKGFGWLFGGDL